MLTQRQNINPACCHLHRSILVCYKSKILYCGTDFPWTFTVARKKQMYKMSYVLVLEVQACNSSSLGGWGRKIINWRSAWVAKWVQGQSWWFSEALSQKVEIGGYKPTMGALISVCESLGCISSVVIDKK